MRKRWGYVAGIVGALLVIAVAVWIGSMRGKETDLGAVSTPPSASEPAPQATPLANPPVASAPPGPDLMAVTSPDQLTVTDLAAGLQRYLSEGNEPPGQRLQTLYTRWKLNALVEGQKLMTEADLDGDGTQEVVTALNGANPQGGLVGLGAILVGSKPNGQWQVTASETVPGLLLVDAADLTGDGKPEMIGASTDVGAHTAHYTVYVWQWSGGQFQRLPGDMVIASARFAVDGRDLLLKGGMIGSAGAGLAQRDRTDRYRWVGGRFQLVDRQFTTSTLGYHRMLDGVVAEQFGRTGDARQAYMDAMDPARSVAPPDWLEPDRAGAVPDAVRALARLRLVALLLQQGDGAGARQAAAGATGPFAGLVTAAGGGANRDAACKAAQGYAEQNPAFLNALGGVFGYANPEWYADTLCGPLKLVD